MLNVSLTYINVVYVHLSAKLIERTVDPVTGQSRVKGPSLDLNAEVRGPLTAQVCVCMCGVCVCVCVCVCVHLPIMNAVLYRDQ